MSFNINDYGGAKVSAPLLEAGVAYPARVVSVVLLGLQPGREFQGQKKDPAHEIALTYEFLDEFMVDEDGQPDESKPRWFTEIMPLFGMGSERAKSTLRYKAIDPTNKYDGDFSKLVNEPVMVTIVHNPKKDGGVWENVGGVSRMREKQAEAAPALVNGPILFDPASPDLEVFMKLPKFIKERITTNLNYEGSELQKLLKDAGSDAPGKGTESVPPQEASVEDDNPF